MKMTAITHYILKSRENTTYLGHISPITPNEISIVIPVRNNENGINTFLESFIKTQKPKNYPLEIIIVDNNDKLETIIKPKILLSKLNVKIFHCKTKGPGNARNVGWRRSKGKWILFTDSDCIATESIIEGFINNQNGSIGYSGNVKSVPKGNICEYYDSQKILVPLINEMNEPEYLITANALVYREGLEKIKGFNPQIRIAAGEDIDLGIKLRKLGKLTYCEEAIVMHDFEENLDSFKERFIRYGLGNKIIATLYNLDMTPKLFEPNVKNSINHELASIQYNCLLKGYNSDNENCLLRY